MGEVRIRFLGPVAVDGIEVRARQQRLLLALLGASSPEGVSASSLVASVWGDRPPVDDRKALQVLVARLRKVLVRAGAEIVLDGGGYALRCEAGATDLDAFVVACDQAAAPGCAPAARRDLLASAVALWRGQPFGDVSDEPSLRECVSGLQLRYDDAVGRLHSLRLDAGDIAGLVPELAAWARQRPLDERAWCRLALALHMEGRPTEALRALYTHGRAVREAGVEPTADFAALEARLLADEVGSSTRAIGNLTAAARPLFGRGADIRSVSALLESVAQVTLAGVGGIGKTSLAVAVAEGMRHHHRDGVWLCELADIEDEGALVGLRRACPSLVILTTSREPLGLADEHVYPVGPLAVPDPEGATVDRSAPAVAMFLDRARSAGTVVPEDGGTARAIAEVCARFDGLPLAIELAAARTRSMSIREMSIRLDERFRLLSQDADDRPSRQRTLWDAIDWSYQLLDDGQRDVFCAMSVCLSGWTVDAVAAVTALDEADAEEMVWALAERSLVTVVPGSDVTRYGMLETLRQFGLVPPRAIHKVELAEVAQPGVRGPAEAVWVGRLTAELANLRSAHQFAAASGAVGLGARLVVALHDYAEWRQFFELGTWAVTVLDSPAVPIELAPQLHAIAGWGCCIAADFEAAAGHARRGLAVEREGGRECGWLHDVLAHCAYFQGDHEAGIRHGEEEIERACASGDPYRLSYVLADNGTHAVLVGQHDLGRERAAEALEIAERIGNPAVVSMAQLAHGFLFATESPLLALDWFRRSARLADTVNSTWTSAICRGELALHLGLHGDPVEAVDLAEQQLRTFVRAGDKGRARGIVRMAVPALRRLLPADLAVLHGGTVDRPMIREPHVDEAIEAVLQAVGVRLGAAGVENGVARGSVMDDDAIFDLALDLMAMVHESQT
jgi:DNA-binding SARP family transcriptional activator